MAARLRLTEEMISELDRLTLVTHSYHKTVEQLREWGLLLQENDFLCTNQDCNSLDFTMQWYKEDSKQILEDLDVQHVGRVSSQNKIERHTVSKFYKYLRTQISEYMGQNFYNTPLCTQPITQVDESNPMNPITYHQPVVEADESLFTHLANKEGAWESQCWVIGAVDRLDGRFRVVAIGKERSQPKFQKFLRENVATNPQFGQYKTRVFTDGHKSYQFLRNAGYDHTVVIHDKGFGRGHQHKRITLIHCGPS
ncbi:hypothetical protein ABPG72_005871 [Tetrahymena utriculariae]